MAYNFETDASSSRTDQVDGEKEGDMVEGAVVCCASIPTTWDGWVKAGGAGAVSYTHLTLPTIYSV